MFVPLRRLSARQRAVYVPQRKTFIFNRYWGSLNDQYNPPHRPVHRSPYESAGIHYLETRHGFVNLAKVIIQSMHRKLLGSNDF